MVCGVGGARGSERRTHLLFGDCLEGSFVGRVAKSSNAVEGWVVFCDVFGNRGPGSVVLCDVFGKKRCGVRHLVRGIAESLESELEWKNREHRMNWKNRELWPRDGTR